MSIRGSAGRSQASFGVWRRGAVIGAKMHGHRGTLEGGAYTHKEKHILYVIYMYMYMYICIYVYIVYMYI